jgi:hypothetical protein
VAETACSFILIGIGMELGLMTLKVESWKQARLISNEADKVPVDEMTKRHFCTIMSGSKKETLTLPAAH